MLGGAGRGCASRAAFNPYYLWAYYSGSGQAQGYNTDTTTILRFANYGELTNAQGQDITPVGTLVNNGLIVLPDPRASVPPVPGSGSILLENGAVIDVSGIPDTELPAAYNLLTLSLAGNELADSPLQQDTFLYGAKVTVDMRLSGTNSETGESWVGTPLANLSSYLNLEQQSIGQLLVNGGAVYFNANQFVGTAGSTINIMGGYLNYLGGMVNTTRLIGANGLVYHIGSASPDMTYVGIAGQFTVDHSHWASRRLTPIR